MRNLLVVTKRRLQNGFALFKGACLAVNGELWHVWNFLVGCGSESLVNKKKRVRGVSHERVYGGVTSCSFLGLTRKEAELSCWRPPRRQPMGQHKPALGLSFSLKSLRYLFPIPTIGSHQTWRSPSLFPHLNVGFTCWCFQRYIRKKDVSGCAQSN